MLQPAANIHDDSNDASTQDTFQQRRQAASVILGVGETASFNAVYRPKVAERSEAFVKLSVVDNQYEDRLLQMVGEGHQDDITLDNITSVPTNGTSVEFKDGALAEDISAARSNILDFGHCPIDIGRTLTVAVTSHSVSDCVRFSWPQHPLLQFNPQVGHLHAGCAKDVSVTFLTKGPITLKEEAVAARIIKVVFDSPIDEVADWDDRLKAVKWVDVVKAEDQNTPSRPMKRKITKMKTEPAHTEVEESVRDIELLVSAMADYCQYSCDTSAINFKDTLMFQTRFYEMTLENSGPVILSYSWKVLMEQAPSPVQRSLTVLGEGQGVQTLLQVDSSSAPYIPFSVDPACGTLDPGKVAVCAIKFSPLDVGDFVASLTCRIPNLEGDCVGPEISLRGHGLMPFCHFDLPDSDYISGFRRNPDLPGPGGVSSRCALDPNTHVLECEAVGVGVLCIRKFSIINPTCHQYQFEWQCEDRTDQRLQSPFNCLYPQGRIDSGCRIKVGFKFLPSQLGIVESFWRFVIASQNISIPFLLVGHTQEPVVFLDRSHISFKPLLIGIKGTETLHLINKESRTFSFQFVEHTCHCEGFASSVMLEPMSGQVPPNSRLAVKVSFVPTLEKEVAFNIVCKIQHRLASLRLNIKAEGFTMNCKLYCENSCKERLLLPARGINQISFGNVQVMQQAKRHFFIYNSSKFPLNYCWQFTDCAAVRHDLLQIDKMKGSVACSEMEQCTLIFCPVECVALKACQLCLKISNGPTYNMNVMGQGVLPGLQLSFDTYDFGHTFVYCQGMPAATAILNLTNKDTKDISICCLYTPTAQLQYIFEACVLPVGMSVDIPFRFRPHEACHYKEVVIFEINGTSQRTVEFSGTGCEMKVEVADRNNKQVKLGSCFVGDVVKKQIAIINRSSAPITFSIVFTPICPKLREVGLLSVAPAGLVTLHANGGTTNVDILFKPKARIPPFNEQVSMQCANMIRPLFVLSGTCLGMEIVLDPSYVPFGTVFLGSCTSRKITLTNYGDVNTRFRWDTTHFLPDFSIEPVEGYITPGMDITFDLHFHPDGISADIRYENLHCFLDGGPHNPILLTLTGSCTDITPMKDAYSFSTQVRGRDTKLIPIANRTTQTWYLSPVIEGQQWSGPVTFTVEAQQTRSYELIYRPLTMTIDCKHQGTIFFPFPDGTGQLFNLVGNADPPRPISKVNQEVPCKTDYTQSLTVRNWLPKPQRFSVKIEVIKPEKLDPGLKFKGMDYIDMPANSKEMYKLDVYAYREGSVILRVTFTHEPSGEYQFHDVIFRFTKPGVVSVVELCTPVRRTLQHSIPVDNPLGYQVTFTANCSIPEVVMPSHLTVAPLSKGQFSFEYMPLKMGEVQGKLEFVNSDLGLFIYDLMLRATPPTPEKTICLRVPLGQSQVQTIRFLSYIKHKLEYSCKVESPDFQVDKSVLAIPATTTTTSTEVNVDVTFEPSRLGEQRTILTVSSPVGGDYIFPLLATCTPPTPQGPIQVRAGIVTHISFRNIFFSTVTFTVQVEGSQFHVHKQLETIRAKKDQRIMVYFDGGIDLKVPVSGRLVVSCPGSTGGASCIQWVYYLKGIAPRKEDIYQHKVSSIQYTL